MTICCANQLGNNIIEQIMKDDLHNLDAFLRIYITVKLSNIDSEMASILMNYIVIIYCNACKQGKTQILDKMFKYKTISNNIPRHDVLHGISLTIHEKTIKSFINFIGLLNTFNITIDEINGITFNLLQYCVLCDNVDALHYLLEKYKINVNDMSVFQKELLVDTIIFNTSRHVLKYLYDSGKLSKTDVNNVPYNFIENKVFARELVIKYGYLASDSYILNTFTHKNSEDIYKTPQNRFGYNWKHKENRHLKQYNNIGHRNRSDNDHNWRK